MPCQTAANLTFLTIPIGTVVLRLRPRGIVERQPCFDMRIVQIVASADGSRDTYTTRELLSLSCGMAGITTKRVCMTIPLDGSPLVLAPLRERIKATRSGLALKCLEMNESLAADKAG